MYLYPHSVTLILIVFAPSAVALSASESAYRSLRETVLLSDCPFPYLSSQTRLNIMQQHGLLSDHLSDAECDAFL